MNNIPTYRKKIDQIDQKILKLLSQRVKIVEQVGLYKKERGIKIKDPRREKEILAKKAEQASSLGLSPDFVKKLWQLFFKESYKIEE